MVEIAGRPADTAPAPDIPEWVRCDGCAELVYGKRFARALHVCPDCGGHARLTARQRLDLLLDPGTEIPLDAGPTPEDPLGFTDSRPYRDRLAEARAATGMSDAVLAVRGHIDGRPLVVAAMDFRFLGGSLGCAVGALVERAAHESLRTGAPLLIVTASGGARMQEGALALMQMAKTAQALAELDEAGVLVMTLVTDPTYGGVAASFATLADVILIEPGARMGFAGPRVIEQTTGESLPEGFQTADFLLAHGMVDAVVARPQLRRTIGHLVAAASAARSAKVPDELDPALAQFGAAHELGYVNGQFSFTLRGGAHTALPANGCAPVGHDAAGDRNGRHAAPTANGGAPSVRETGRVPADVDQPGAHNGSHIAVGTNGHAPAALAHLDAPRAHNGSHTNGRAPADPDAPSAWETVRLARHPARPSVLAYAGRLLEDFHELHGDRIGGDCPAVVGGIGSLDGQPLVLIGHEKGGDDIAERRRRHFGMATPAGYRKAARLMRMAAKLGLPVLTLVDTPGANPGSDAERGGQAVAIAENLRLMARLPVPIVTVVTGEGGSGGALALAVADRVLISERGVYSVISPEGCAAILWKDPAAAPLAADALRLGPAELLALGVVDATVPEPPGGAHTDPGAAAALLRDALLPVLAELRNRPPDRLIRERRDRFRRFGSTPSTVNGSAHVHEGAQR